jgi:hypothetical protein
MYHFLITVVFWPLNTLYSLILLRVREQTAPYCSRNLSHRFNVRYRRLNDIKINIKSSTIDISSYSFVEYIFIWNFKSKTSINTQHATKLDSSFFSFPFSPRSIIHSTLDTGCVCRQQPTKFILYPCVPHYGPFQINRPLQTYKSIGDFYGTY